MVSLTGKEKKNKTSTEKALSRIMERGKEESIECLLTGRSNQINSENYDEEPEDYDNSTNGDLTPHLLSGGQYRAKR